MQKSEMEVDPPWGMGSGLERANSKNIVFYYDWLKYYQTLISETSWSLYGMKPIFTTLQKF